MPKSDSSRWWLAAEAALALALVAAPWCLGGAPDWALWVVGGLGFSSLGLWTIGAARNHRRWQPHPMLLLPAGAALVCLVQLVPLPPTLLAAVSPPADELRSFALVPLGLGGWRPISLDPGSTGRAFARFLVLTALTWAALELGRREVVRQRLMAVQALAGLSIAVTGFVHLLAGLDALFGVHHFAATLSLITPFGNANHLAAYLAMSGTTGLALALSTRSRDAAIGWAAVALVCGVGVFLTYSRGGIATFVATWALVAAAVLAQKGGGLRSVLPWVVMGSTVLFAGLLAFEQLVARAETVSTFERLRSTKIDLWPMLWNGTRPTWLAGMGTGAFELGFSRWQTQQLDVTFTHPENVAFQSLADRGLVLTTLLLAFSVWQVRRTWVRVWSLPLERTVLLALVGVVLHEVFDFSLELHAVAPTCAVLLGLVVGAESETGGRRSVGRAGPLLVLSAAALVALAWWRAGPTHLDDEAAVMKLIRDRAPLDRVRAAAIAAIDRHPSDWVLFADVASDLAQRGDPREALAWINRHLFLRPNDPRAHAAAGAALLRSGQALQALGEFKTAWALGDPTTLEVGLAVAIKHDAYDRILLDKPGHLSALWDLLHRTGRYQQGRALLAAVELSGVGAEVVQEAALLMVRQEAELGEPSKALAAWEALPADLKLAPEQQLVRVTLLERVGRPDEALAALEAVVARAPERPEWTMRLVDALAARGRTAAAHEALERHRPYSNGVGPRSALFQKEAALYMQEQRWSRALASLETAARLEPTRADLQYLMADVLEKMGSLHSALDAVRRGRVLDSPEGAKRQDARVARLEAAMAISPP